MKRKGMQEIALGRRYSSLWAPVSGQPGLLPVPLDHLYDYKELLRMSCFKSIMQFSFWPFDFIWQLDSLHWAVSNPALLWLETLSRNMCVFPLFFCPFLLILACVTHYIIFTYPLRNARGCLVQNVWSYDLWFSVIQALGKSFTQVLHLMQWLVMEKKTM